MSALTILRDDAVALCVALGFRTAGSWNKQRMAQKMADLAEMVEDGAIEVEDDADDAERLNDLLLQIGEAKGDVNVVQELPSDEEGAEEPEDEAEEDDDEPADEPKDDIDEATDDAEEEPVSVKSKKARKQSKKQPKAEKPTKKQSKQSTGRAKILGKYSAGPFVRWLGRNGVDLEGAQFILRGEKCDLKDVSVKWELKERREGRNPADVSSDDEKTLRKSYAKAFSKS